MIPDIVEIKRLCVSGQWYTKIENGQILLHDTIAGETVCIGRVDAEPVRHSEWVEEKDRVRHWHCRECGLVEGMAHYMMHYCPNCGAKMNGV